MKEPIKHMLVGTFILGAIALFVGMILFLKPTVGDGKQTIYVRFSDINNLGVGTRVLFAGKPVGEVESIEEIQDARNEPTDELGRVYFYQLTLKIDSHIAVYTTDEVSLETSGLLGEKSIAISPKAAPKGVTLKLVANEPIYADSVDMLQNALLDFSELAARMEETFGQITHWMINHGEEVALAVKATAGAMEQIDGAIDEMREGKTFENIADVMGNLKQISGDIADGKGTIGKLVVEDDLYLQMEAILSKANGLMNAINQYGLLFHLNKQWQRTHLQQVSLLNALDTPQSFRTYFQKEVDGISSSMGRLSMLIEKADASPEREAILRSSRFKQDFAQLLRNVAELEDQLRLYNQQLNGASRE